MGFAQSSNSAQLYNQFAQVKEKHLIARCVIW